MQETTAKSALSSVSGEDHVALEMRLFRSWREKWIERDMKVAPGAWFDYRDLHPVTRSKLFVLEYERAHERAFIRFFGEPAKGDEWRKLPRAKKPLYSRNPRTIGKIIGYMQTVDEAMIPYDVYFDGAFHHLMQDRGFTRFWKQNDALSNMDLPPITSMVDGEIIISSMRHFERLCLKKVRAPVRERYRASNWRGTSDQKQYANWMISQAMRRGGDAYWSLARMVYERDQVREKEVARKLGIEAVKNIRSIKSKL